MKSISLLIYLSLGALSAFSQVRTDPFIYSFTTVPLWDFSGEYMNSVQGAVVTVQLVHSANGKISGTKTEVAVTATENLYGSAYVTGRVFWSPQSMGINVLPYKETLSGTVNGSPLLANATVRGKMTLVPSLLAFQTSGTARVCAVGGRCVTSNQSYQLPLPAGMTGDWTLGFLLTQRGNKISGVAAISLSTGRILSYNVSGSYNPRSGASMLRVVGYSETQGNSLVVKTTGPQMNLVSLTGNVLGQKLKY